MHQVDIKIQNEGMADAYVGQYFPILTPLVGLAKGISRVYKKLKV